FFFFFQAEDGIRDFHVTGVQTCALPIFAVPALDPVGVQLARPHSVPHSWHRSLLAVHVSCRARGPAVLREGRVLSAVLAPPEKSRAISRAIARERCQRG